VAEGEAPNALVGSILSDNPANGDAGNEETDYQQGDSTTLHFITSIGVEPTRRRGVQKGS